jgi:phytanoyl-CoA hydroxylase
MTTIYSDAKRDFDRDGFVILRGFLSPPEFREFDGNLQRYIRDVMPRIPRERKFFGDLNRPETLKQLAAIRENDPFFEAYINREKYLSLARALLDDDVVPQECEWFDKPPALNNPTPPHQDGFYFMLEPNEAVTLWVPQDEVDASNCCLRYVRRSHRDGLREHQRSGVLGFSLGMTDFADADRAREVEIHLQPGDLVAHHSLMIHRAEENTSPRHRRALGLIYYAKRATQDKQRLEDYKKEWKSDFTAAGKL